MNPRLCRLLFVCLIVLAEQGVIGSQSAPLPPTGAITGTVLDQAGHPVVAIRVQAIERRKKWSGPYYEVAIGRPDESDDRGQFRLHSLPPGEYVVAVSMQPEEPRAASPPTRVSSAPEYLRTYSLGTTSLREAQPVVVSAGQEQTVSIRVTPARYGTVSGVATTSNGMPAANFDVSLRGDTEVVDYDAGRGAFRAAMGATTRTAEDGTFSLMRVPPGVYTLTVVNGRPRGQSLEIAEMPIQIDGTRSGINVVTERGATLSGRLEWGDPGPQPWPWKGKIGRLRATAIGRELDFASIDAEVNSDGTFEFTNLYGLRRIEAMFLPFSWTIKSVEAPSVVMAGRNLDIRLGRVITDLKIVVTSRIGKMIALVTDENFKPFPTGWVLLMSQDRAELDALGWGFRVTRWDHAQVPGSTQYTMDGILPGSYLAVAIDVEPHHLRNDTDLMERARARARVIEIREGNTQVNLRVVRLQPFVKDPPKP